MDLNTLLEIELMLEAPSEYCSVSPQVGRRKPDVSGAETNIKGGVSFKNCTEHKHFILPCDDKIPGFQIISLDGKHTEPLYQAEKYSKKSSLLFGIGSACEFFWEA